MGLSFPLEVSIDSTELFPFYQKNERYKTPFLIVRESNCCHKARIMGELACTSAQEGRKTLSPSSQAMAGAISLSINCICRIESSDQSPTLASHAKGAVASSDGIVPHRLRRRGDLPPDAVCELYGGLLLTAMGGDVELTACLVALRRLSAAVACACCRAVLLYGLAVSVTSRCLARRCRLAARGGA